MERMCWDTRATDSIIKSGQKDAEASIERFHVSNTLLSRRIWRHLKNSHLMYCKSSINKMSLRADKKNRTKRLALISLV